MNKSIFKPFATLLCMVMSLGLTACGDDDEKDAPANPTELKTVEVSYKVDITPDYLAYYDVTVTYGTDDTTGTTSKVTTDSWSFTQTFDKSSVELPKKVFCKMTATPKNPAPAFDSETVYNFGSSYAMRVNGVTNTNTTTPIGYSEYSHSLNVKGDKIQQLLDRGERILVNFTQKIK